MSANENQQSPQHGKLVLFVVPIIAGILVDGASEFIKVVSHGITNHLKDFLDWKIGNWHDLRDAPIALVFSIAMLIVPTLLLEKYSDPRAWVRNVLLVLSLVFAGVFQPWTLFNRHELLRAFDDVHNGESVSDVLTAMRDSPATIQRHEEGMRNSTLGKYSIYCEGKCWLRLTYDVPSLWSRPFVEIDFDSNQNEIRKGFIP